MLMPPRGRLSLIHVDDLARLLLALAEPDAPDKLIDRARRRQARRLDPPRVRATRSPRRSACPPATIATPRFLLAIGSRLDRLVRGEQGQADARPGRLFLPPRLGRRTPSARFPLALWQPKIPTPQGLKDTAGWYRREGWL